MSLVAVMVPLLGFPELYSGFQAAPLFCGRSCLAIGTGALCVALCCHILTKTSGSIFRHLTLIAVVVRSCCGQLPESKLLLLAWPLLLFLS
jgi:hypothetical protein